MSGSFQTSLPHVYQHVAEMAHSGPNSRGGAYKKIKLKLLFCLGVAEPPGAVRREQVTFSNRKPQDFLTNPTSNPVA
ncbi:hypothetical protein COCON_G00195770 [Conger conger]|uniref:Uncharacterized protein n=1 Tax=Conger conger TaxID=82655 RepID=A0A9Q1D1Y9_CONCO|nr:hypothetical protein COCON_G00195770 [Conger conger]